MATLPQRSIASSPLLARNATLNLITEGWLFIVLVVAMPKLVSYLGETSFGLFSLAWVFIGYLAFLDIGVNRAATKFVSEHLAEQDRESTRLIVRTAITANLALGLAGGLAVILISPYLIHSLFKVSPELQNEARLAFYAVGLAIPVSLVQGVFRAVLSSYQRFGYINAVNAAATTAQWTAAAVLAWRGHGVVLVVLATVVARVLAATAYGIALARVFPDLQFFRIHGMHGLPKLLRFGGWVTVSQLVSPLLVYLDRVLIASFVSLAAVTLYTVPFEVMTRLRVIPSSFVSTLYPAFSERGAAGQKDQLQRLFEGSVRYLLIMLLPGVLFLVVLGPDLLTVWMGSQFSRETSVVLQILGFGTLLNCMANIPYYALQALGRPDLPGRFHLVELFFYAGLCALMTYRWGITGAALASTLRVSVDAILLFWAVGRYCQCSMRPLWGKVLPGILFLNGVLGVMLVGIHFGVNGVWTRLGIGVFVSITYFLAVWMFLIEKGHKPRIAEAVKLLRGQPVA